MKKPLVSVIMPIYNVETYLNDAFNSLTQQSLAFEDNIEVILVDDGSTDKSVELCKEFVNKYPTNVKLYTQLNAGVSKARNTGLKNASGKYMHFFDADDKLSKNFYETTTVFLEQHKDVVDFVATKLMFFDKIIDAHPLNYKFNRSRVIDVRTEPNNPILHVISCVFDREALADQLFDERLSIAEDMKFVSDVLIRKKKYGVLKAPTYHYRKRKNNSSAIGGKERTAGFYIDTPRYAYKHMLDTWNRVGIPEYAEHTLLYDLSYRLEQASQQTINTIDEMAYKKSIQSLLIRCSDKSIASSGLTSAKKYYILKLKYADNVDTIFHGNDKTLFLEDEVFVNYDTILIHLDFITKTKNQSYRLEGYIDNFIDLSSMSVFVQVSGKTYPIRFVQRFQRQKSFLGDIYDSGCAFEADIELNDKNELQFLIIADKHKICPKIIPGPFTRMSLMGAYRRDDDMLLKRSSRHIRVFKRTSLRHFIFEAKTWFTILLDWRLSKAAEQFKKLLSRNLADLDAKTKIFELLKPELIVIEAIVTIPQALMLRLAYFIMSSTRKRPVWLVSDRGMAAGDNGEAMFQYISQQKECPADVRFVISKESTDFERIKSIGPAVHYGSLRYKLKFLLADKVISSQADIEVTNPYRRQFDRFADLLTFDFIFLQHGVIRNDLSDWLNRFEKNISVFITSGKKEYDSIFSYPYYYGKNQVVLTGLPRYDHLHDASKKKVVIAPTHRKHLLRLNTNKYGARAYDPSFKASDYSLFYNRLMADPRLLASMDRNKVGGEFYVHPNFAEQSSDFKGNSIFTIMQYPYNYRRAVNEGSLLVSDYSSIAFDFAYLKKPMIYSQFDVDTFFENHVYKQGDFFNDEKDGFGPVTYDYDATVAALVNYIEADFKNDSQYTRREENFFMYNDNKNCERVYRSILGFNSQTHNAVR